MSSSNGVGAYNASVRVSEPERVVRAARVQRVADCTEAVTVIEAKIAALHGDTEADRDWTAGKLAALDAALQSATAEAEQARAEAREGSE